MPLESAPRTSASAEPVTVDGESTRITASTLGLDESSNDIPLDATVTTGGPPGVTQQQSVYPGRAAFHRVDPPRRAGTSASPVTENSEPIPAASEADASSSGAHGGNDQERNVSSPPRADTPESGDPKHKVKSV